MEITKICIKCSQELPLEDYYIHPKMKDGHLNKCKTCCRNDNRENRQSKVDYYRSYDKKRKHRTDYNKVKECRVRYPNQYKAHNILNNALRDGKIVRPNKCSECGSKSSVVGHHNDYLEPLKVTWLCQACHVNWHKINGEGLNKS